MQPLLSIVIATYNNENTIKKAVDSVLIQKFENWELLLVDDGATDSCPQIVDDYAKSDSRIKAFHKANGGCNSAFNVGLAQATGKYVTFCGADDTYEPNAFEIIAEQAAEYDYDVIFILANLYNCDNNQNIINCWGRNILPFGEIALRAVGKDNVEKIYKDLYNRLLLVNNTINAYKTNIMKKYRYKEDVYGADYLINIDLADDVHSISCHPKQIYNHFTYVNDENYNISIGKYYPYTHTMYNEFYTKTKDLFLKWNISSNMDMVQLASNRINLYLQDTLNAISAPNNPNSSAENINLITEYYDDIIFETATLSNNLTLVDEVFFNEILKLVQNSELPNNFDNPIFRMISALNNTEISLEDIKTEIAYSLLDYQNPYRIGFEFYKAFSAKHTQIANSDLVEYLETECTARKLLVVGKFEYALDMVMQSFNGAISTAEQYVILALCGYNLGLTEDAKNAVEVGLANFPNYPRLEELREIILTTV